MVTINELALNLGNAGLGNNLEAKCHSVTLTCCKLLAHKEPLQTIAETLS